MQDFDEDEFEVDPEKNLVEEEIKEEERKFHLKMVKERKERILLATEVAKMCLEDTLIDEAMEAANMAINSEWDPQKDLELVIAQGEAHLVLAKCMVEYLLEDDIDVGYRDLVTIYDD